MSERPQESGAPPEPLGSAEPRGLAEPTEEELSEILADLEFFLDMERAETLPLDDGREGNGAGSD